MSYDPTSTSDRDRARAKLGDTSNDPATELLTDAHMDSVLEQYGYALGVAFMADELAARYAQQPGSVGLPSGLSVSWPERVKNWQRIAAEMRAEATRGARTPAVTSRALNRAVW